MQILCLLVEKHGQVLSKNEIIQELWPGAVVGQDVVTRAIFELRKIFLCSSQSPTFIETVSRKGYCFIHPVIFAENEHHETSEQGSFGSSQEKLDLDAEKLQLMEPASSESQSFSEKGIYTRSLFVAAILLIMSIAFFKSFSPDLIENNIVQPEIIVDESQSTNFPSLSATAKSLAVVKNSDNSNVNDIYIIDLVTHKQSRLTKKSARYSHLKWSKNRNVLYYESCAQQQCQLKANYLDLNKTTDILTYTAPLLGFDLSPNEDEILLNTLFEGRTFIKKLNIESQTITNIGKGDNNIVNPKYSVDATSYYFVAQSNVAASILKKYNPSNGIEINLITNFDRIYDYLPVSDNKFWLAAKHQGINAFWLYDTTKNKILYSQQSPNNRIISNISTDRKFKTFAFKFWHRNYDVDVLGVDLDSKKFNSSGLDFKGHYSDLTHSIYFVSNRSGNFEIWQSRKGEVQKLTAINALTMSSPIIDAKGQFMAFTALKDGETKLFIYNLATQQIISTHTLHTDINLLSWSSKSNYVMYSLFEAGMPQIVKHNIIDHSVNIIARSAGYYAEFFETSNTLVYVDIATQSLVKKIGEGKVETLLELAELNLSRNVNNIKYKDAQVFYIVDGADTNYLEVFDLNTKNKTKLYDISKGAVVTQINLSKEPVVIFDHFVNDKTTILTADFSSLNRL